MGREPPPRPHRFGCSNCFFTLLLLSLAGPELFLLFALALAVVMAVAWGTVSLLGAAAMASLGWAGRHWLLVVALSAVAVEAWIVRWVLRHPERAVQTGPSARAQRPVAAHREQEAPITRGLSPSEPAPGSEHGLSRQDP